MRLIVGPEPEAFFDAATPEVVHAMFFAADLWYGTRIELRADGGTMLAAVAGTSPDPEATGPSAFTVTLAEGGETWELMRPCSRDEAAALFERYAAGDVWSVDELEWEALRFGSPTGRLRPRRAPAEAAAAG